MAWQVEIGNGIYLPDIGWRLDAQKPSDKVFASHAHFDHMGKHETILCTPATRELIQARLKGERQWRCYEFEEEFEIEPDVRAKLYPAGHILGSAMLWVEKNGTSLLYTGDFNLSPSFVAEECVVPQADVLIMETTYGLPRYTFRPIEETMKGVVQFCRDTLDNGDTPILFAYSLGKGQEVLKGLEGSGLAIALHPKCFAMSNTCRDLGAAFPEYQELDEANTTGQVIISPNVGKDTKWLKSIPNRKTAMLSGWANDSGATYRFQSDKAFPLSDHSDYLDLQVMVSRVEAKRIYTTHGFASEFADTLRDQGYDALALGVENQLGLGISSDPNPAFEPKGPPPQSESEHTKGAPNSFYRFSQVAQSIEKTDSAKQKRKLLGTYLESLEVEDLALACLYCSGQAFPRSSTKALGIDRPLIKQSVILATGSDDAEFKTLYQQSRDSNKVIQQLLGRLTTEPIKSLSDISKTFSALSAAAGLAFKQSFLVEEFKKLTPIESASLIKLIKGTFNIGLSEEAIEETLADHFQRSIDSIRDANIRCRDFQAVAIATAKDQLEALRIEIFRPIELMPAVADAALPSFDSEWWCEDQYDGYRCQIHKRGERVEIFDHLLNEVTHQFPEVLDSLRMIPQDFIGDCAIVAWEDERPLPFSKLEERIDRKSQELFLGQETPVIIWLCDLLWFNGSGIMDRPLSKRRSFLDTFSVNSAVRITAVSVVRDADWVQAECAAAKDRGNVGLVLKQASSPYRAGRQNEFWRRH